MTIALVILAASITVIGVYASIQDAQAAAVRSSGLGHQHTSNSFPIALSSDLNNDDRQ